MNTYSTIESLYKLFISCDQKITTDTRRIEHGSIFFALKGDNFDANTFAQKAIEQGCSYAVVDNPDLAGIDKMLVVENVLECLQQLAKHHRKQLQIPIIGITGSNGKTTNKELIHAVLSKKYNTYATKGNLNNHIGVPLTLLAITAKHQMAIVEMGANHQGEIELLSNLSDPDYGIITNIGKAHLEGFGGVEGIKKGKSELYKHIKNKNGKLFINGDDLVLKELAAGIDKIYYGEKEEFDVYGKLYSESEYVNFKWNVKHLSLENKEIIPTHLFGHYNFINLLCATCIGSYFKVDEQAINDALSNYIPEMNRSQVKKTASNTLILDAYNANPTSMHLAIDNFIKQNFERNYFVLGDMLELGIYSDEEHQKILQQLLIANCKQVILIGEQFYKWKDSYSHFLFYLNTNEAMSYFTNHPLINTTVLIKGSRGIRLEKLTEVL